MNCRQVQEKIKQKEPTLENTISEHLLTCKICQDWLDERLLEDMDLEDELISAFEAFPVDPDVHLKISEQIFKRKKHKDKFLIVAIIAALICVPFAYGIIKELPLFSKAQEQYIADETSAFIQELGIPVVESYFENEAYKLYVKDIFANYKGITLQIAVLDSTNESPVDYHVELISTGLLGLPSVYYFDLESNRAWFSLTVDLPEDYQSIQVHPMEIRLVKGKVDMETYYLEEESNVVLSHLLQVDLSHLSKIEDITFKLDKTFTSEFFDVHLNELTKTSTGFYVSYELKNKISTTYHALQFTLSDDKGNQYHASSSRIIGDKYTVYYENVVIDHEARELYLDDIEVTFIPTTKIAEMTIYPIAFEYEGIQFTFQKTDKSSPLMYELMTSKAIPSSDFPNIAAMKGIHSQFFNRINYEEQTFLITETLMKNALKGKSITSLETEEIANDLSNYVHTKYHIKLELENLIQELNNLDIGDGETEFYVEIEPERIDKILYEATSALTQPFDLVVQNEQQLDQFEEEVLILPLD